MGSGNKHRPSFRNEPCKHGAEHVTAKRVSLKSSGSQLEWCQFADLRGRKTGVRSDHPPQPPFNAPESRNFLVQEEQMFNGVKGFVQCGPERGLVIGVAEGDPNQAVIGEIAAGRRGKTLAARSPADRPAFWDGDGVRKLDLDVFSGNSPDNAL